MAISEIARFSTSLEGVLENGQQDLNPTEVLSGHINTSIFVTTLENTEDSAKE